MTDPCVIDLWIWSLRGSDPDPDLVLGPEEQARASRFVRPQDRAEFIVAHDRMRRILATYTGSDPAALAFATVARSKPVIPGGPAFSLSHSGGYAALAVAPGQTEDSLPLGLDIEAHRPVEPGVAKLSFSETEQARLATLKGQDWTDAFFRCWTRKEAVIKALGLGLYADLGGFDVTLGRSEPAALTRAAGDLPAPDLWQMRGFELGPAMPGALACVTQRHGIRVTIREAPESARPAFRF